MKKSASQNPQIKLAITTRDGDFLATYSGKGLARLNFPSAETSARLRNAGPQHEIPETVHRWHKLTTVALKQVLSGEDAESLPPLDLSVGTDFQRSVWQAMRQIGSGHTRSYGEIAAAVGNAKAVRAVGGACGANPIPVLVPCHRVLAAHKKIGGFSSGLHWKRTLLTREGVRV